MLPPSCLLWKLLTCACILSCALLLSACSTGTSANSAGGSGNGSNSGGSGSGGAGGSGGSGGGTGSSSTSCQQMTLGQNASLGGFLPFNSSSLWNTDISAAPVDANSDSIISTYIGTGTHMHPDFGTDPTYGIPFLVVDGNQKLVGVNLGAYGGESDPGPMPVPANALLEGGAQSTGD